MFRPYIDTVTEERFIGYTRLVLVNDLGDGEYQVSLRKEQQQ